ncbi:MAG: sn-glycerol-3-phosphate ABC transporter ATP-binding protein UgpC [Elusimicrobia bacterium]|nr:sn-glycerol-3-phosphate ABC transporter ATP-binding protein UgpC [Elusimicrobiota bacterium]
MAEVMLKNVSKVYSENVVAVKDVTTQIKDKEFFVLVGPSGCGKSTILRMIAGLEEITSGDLFIDGKKMNDVPPKDRDIAMVFQNYALYPHMKVYDNMAFGLKLRGYSKTEIDKRVKDAGEILGMSQLLNRYPKQLSGGQRQRVAVGRAIVRKPKVFLFDEPLSNLDAKVRVVMRSELKKLHERLDATTIYVTHDQTEAIAMGDKICVVKDGIIQQIDTPLTIYDKPKNKFVAGFIGSPPMNFFDCKIIENSDGIWIDEGRIKVGVLDEHKELLKNYIGKNVIFGVRPESVYDKLYARGATPYNTITAIVEIVEPMGSEAFLHLDTGLNKLVARVDAHTNVLENQNIELVLDMRKIHIFDKETEVAVI